MDHREPHTEPVIAHVVLTLDIGGAEVLVTRMVDSLREVGFHPCVVCLDAEGSLAAAVRRGGTSVTCVERRPGILDLACVRRLRRFFLDTGVTLVHTHDLEAFSYGSLAAWLAGRIPAVHTQHGLPTPFGWRQWLKALAVRHACRRFVGVSDEVTGIGLESGWFVRDRTETITNGVDVVAFRPDPSTRQQTRRALDIPEHDLVVISVARLAEIKDHLTLVRGFAASPLVGTGHLLLVGDGPQRARIEEEIDRVGIAGRTRLLGDRSDVRDLLAGSDVFALTSQSEGISISLLEAMAVGLVPVVTAVGGNKQVVHAEDPTPNGMLIAPGAIDDLAATFQKLADDPDLRMRLGDEARATVRERFSHRAMMDGYISLYAKNRSPQPDVLTGVGHEEVH